jgi:hypothetical protein
MNGSGLSITNFFSPRAMRRIVLSASGRTILYGRASCFERKIE